MSDENGDGLLTPQEFSHCMSAIDNSLTDEDVKILFKSIDKNGDGLLTFEEFSSYIQNGLN